MFWWFCKYEIIWMETLKAFWHGLANELTDEQKYFKWVKQTDRQTDKTSFKNYYRSYFYSKLVLFLSCVLFITEEKVLTIDTFLVSGGIFTLFSWTFTSTSKLQKSLKRILFFLLLVFIPIFFIFVFVFLKQFYFCWVSTCHFITHLKYSSPHISKFDGKCRIEKNELKNCI